MSSSHGGRQRQRARSTPLQSTRARSGGDRGAEGCTGEVVSRKMLPFLMSLRFCKEKGSR